MIGSAVALALFGGIFASHPDDQTQRFEVQGWTGQIRTDAFGGTVACRLRARGVTVSRGAAVFDFGGANTSDAIYRIDGGPAKSGRIAMNGVALLGVRTISADPSNSSGGLVHIPVAELAGASSVAIRPNDGARSRTFDLRGLGAALDTEKQRGCDQAQPF